MKCLDVFILLFYGLDNIYDKQPNEVLGDFLSGMNPFLFKDEGSAVPDIYNKFKKSFKGRFENECSEIEGYYFAKDYIYKLNIKELIDAFEKISLEQWITAVKLYSENNQNY